MDRKLSLDLSGLQTHFCNKFHSHRTLLTGRPYQDMILTFGVFYGLTAENLGGWFKRHVAGTKFLLAGVFTVLFVVILGIFMNVFSVHVNRSPVAACVVRATHQDGVFLDARDPHASERNESATIVLTHTRGGEDYPIVVRQIAGMIAKRIVTAVVPDQELARGERVGMIKFGSRVELFVPTPLAGRVCVELGQKVRAGLTVLVTVDGAGDDE